MRSIWSMASDSSYDLILELWSQKMYFWLFPHLLDLLMSKWVSGAEGGHFLGDENKNSSKPVPKNLFRCSELKKSLIHAYLAFNMVGANIAPPPASPTESKRRLY